MSIYQMQVSISLQISTLLIPLATCLTELVPVVFRLMHWSILQPQERKTIQSIFTLLKQAGISPWYFLPPILLSLAAALFEGISMSLIVPLLNGLLQRDYSLLAQDGPLGIVFTWLPDFFSERGRSVFMTIIGMFVLSAFLRNALRYCSQLGLIYVAFRALHHLRKTLFQRYMTFGQLYFDKTTVGHHSAVLGDQAYLALMPLLKINTHMNSLFSLGAYMVVLCTLSWKLTLFAIPLFYCLQLIVQRIIALIQRYSRQSSQQSKALHKTVVDILSTMVLVKAQNMQEAEQEHYKDISSQQSMLLYRTLGLNQLIQPLQEMVTLFSALVLFGVMLYLLGQNNAITTSSLLTFFYVLSNASTKLTVLSNFRSQVATATGPIESVMEIFDTTDKHIIFDGKKVFTGLKKSITFSNLTFEYSANRPILNDVSFTVPKGGMLAIVGPTGSGKSTLMHLLLRFYDVPQGTVLLDDQDIRSFSAKSIREHIALVNQSTPLLHDTLRTNLTYGLSDVSNADIGKVLDDARLTELVQDLPEGLDTLIGDRGVQLSGGEKQRLAIARALLKKVNILLLDEATSALDSETERLVQEAIDTVTAHATSIVIAHRLSTIKNADHIVVLNEGKVVEEGVFEKLIAKKGMFTKLWEQQMFRE